MNVATYSRVSTQKREQKPEVQIQELRRYCKARRFKIAPNSPAIADSVSRVLV